MAAAPRVACAPHPLVALLDVGPWLIQTAETCPVFLSVHVPTRATYHSVFVPRRQRQPNERGSSRDRKKGISIDGCTLRLGDGVSAHPEGTYL